MFKAATGLLFLGIITTIAAAQSPATVSVAPEPAPAISAQTMLSVKWEELTTEDFLKAITFAKNTCVLPLGVVEKHGPTGPLGTDLLNVRHATVTAALHEYAIVFPEYYFSQIAEAGSQAGTLVYKRSTQLDLLQETVAEMARNGCKKVLIVNGHGGNNSLLPYFAQTQLDSPRDYVVYAFMGTPASAATNQAGQGGQAQAGPSKPGVDGHAGEAEMSNVMSSRPVLVHPERAAEESGANLDRLKLPPGVYTGIWWYAEYPNHYQGDAAGANKARGDLLQEQRATDIANAIRAVKADEVAPALQREFFEKEKDPDKTPQ
jgi:creatinine amidohydrolase